VRGAHLRRRRFDIDGLARLERGLRFLRVVDDLCRRVAVEVWQRNILAHVEVDDETAQPAIFGNEIYAVRDSIPRSVDAKLFAVERDVRFERRFYAEYRAGHFGTSRAYESRETQHLTVRDPEGNRVLRISQRSQTAHFKTF